MYPRAFRYHRASSLEEAVSLLTQLGEEAKLLAGGQSLIPLMKLRFANPAHLVDLSFLSDSAYIKVEGGEARFGALTRHSDVEFSEVAARVPIVHDCAAGIADVQVRNRGTLGGSIAEADPTGDWAPVLFTLGGEAVCLGPEGTRVVPLSEFFLDAFTTVLAPNELIREIRIKLPPKRSGGAYLAVKRCAPVYASASVAVQLVMEDGATCGRAGIALGAVGLTTIRATEAEAQLRGKTVNERSIAAAAEAAMAAADPQTDMRGSAEHKRVLVGTLVKRALGAALRRSRGESVEVSHSYA
ncbi:MAG: FAD binding domain-containing protein [Terriglobales bacterium]